MQATSARADSFGAVVGEGVVDLKMRFGSRFTSVLDLLREGGLDVAREVVRGVRADFPLREVEFLPPVLTPEKILCIGINYANRNADYDDAEVPKYPEHVLPRARLAGRRRAADRAAARCPSSSITKARSRW